MEPTYRDLPAIPVVGLSDRFTPRQTEGIPVLWEKFIGVWTAAGRPFPAVSYGLCLEEPEGEEGWFRYVAAFPRDGAEPAPEGLETYEIPANHYAVFTHRGAIYRIKETWSAIYGQWLPESGLTRAPGPDFERYDERFDPEGMTGETDIYIPVRRES